MIQSFHGCGVEIVHWNDGTATILIRTPNGSEIRVTGKPRMSVGQRRVSQEVLW